MNLHRYFIGFCSIVLAIQVQAQDMDSALTKLSSDLSAKIQSNGSKKVTVLDFTDLQGDSSELGRYIAEQLTVNLVMEKQQFSVLDRANLKSILAEHKLTASGLIDPENAKKLGKFAGVDAIVLGNIVPLGDSISITVKVITTETAEVICATKTKFKQDESVQKLLSQAVASTDFSTAKDGDKKTGKTWLQCSNLIIKIDDIVPNEQNVIVTVTLKNSGMKTSMAVAIAGSPKNNWIPDTTMLTKDGTELEANANAVRGINVAVSYPRDLTVIEPGSSVTGTIKYNRSGWSGGDLSKTKSFKLYLNFLINWSYTPSDYERYEPRDGYLIPKCEVVKLNSDVTLD